MGDFKDEIGKVREEIDGIDQTLKQLLVKRLALSSEVASIKKKYQMPVFDANREKQILDRIREDFPENGDFISAVYFNILSSSRAKQHLLLASGENIHRLLDVAEHNLPNTNVTVLCQGVEGAYSGYAAKLFFDETCIRFFPTWDEIFSLIDKNLADFAVVPVENSAAGAVGDVYSLLIQYRFFVVGAATVNIEHCLAAKSPNSEIKNVISHPQALAQCSEYILAHELQTEKFSNTATAAQFVAEHEESGYAAICSKEAAKKYGLSIIAENIQNAADNATRFVIISKKPYLPIEAKKISLCFSLPHAPGSLSGILSQFAMQNLNLTKIESRPIPGKRFEYDFYLDFTGNIHDTNTQNLICSLSDELPRFSFLGNYIEIES